MILFKKQFKQKMLDGIKTTTYRNKWINFKIWDIIRTNFKVDWKTILIKINNIQEVNTNNLFEHYKRDWFDTQQDMIDYFSEYSLNNLKQIDFQVV